MRALFSEKENVIQLLLNFLEEHALALQQKTCEHIALAGLSLLIASAIAIPLGILIFRVPLLKKIVLNVGSLSQTIPSLATLALLVPLLGLGSTPTIIVLTFYAFYPILHSTYAGLKSVSAEYIEAAKGLGFSNFQRLRIVELPLAFPVIISGIRVATAMTIGTTAIAALIGAGGLGDFIMQGLSLNQPSLILLGALPIALLALFFDYGISRFEKRLRRRKAKSSLFRTQKYFFIVIIMSISVFLGYTFFKFIINDRKDNTIVIASKNFTEQYILAEIMAQLIEQKTSLKVIRKFNLGTTDIVHQAMLRGEVDLYPEYTGTAYLTILKKPAKTNHQEIFEDVKSEYKNRFHILWLEPFGFSNSHVLAVKKEFAKANHILSLSDLAAISHHLTIATTPEFLKRPDGLPGLRQAYGFNFKNTMQIDPCLLYLTLNNQKVDVIEAFTTDGNLQKYQLFTLDDDKKFCISYYASPVISQSVLEKNPQIYEALSHLFGSINEKQMAFLNYQVEGKERSPAEVARQFLLDLKNERP